MKKMLSVALVMAVVNVFGNTGNELSEQPANETIIKFVPTVAVLSFEGRSREFENDNAGKSVAELLSVGLMNAGVNTIERAELDKALGELHLSAIGLVDSDSQVKLGRMIGAKILITGSIFKSGDKTFIVAKIIGTETSRVVGASVNGRNAPTDMVSELKKKVCALLEQRGNALLPAPLTQKSVRDNLAATIKGKQRKVFVKISENINIPAYDPAAQTEIENLLLALGFDVVANRSDAQYAIIGEAFAENAGSYGKFVAAAARIELKVTEVKDEKLLASGAQKERIAGASYQLVAKEAIAQAALRLAGELFRVLK